MNKLLGMALSAAAILVSTPALAQGYDVKRYQSFMSLSAAEKQRDIAYIIGVTRGALLANMFHKEATGAVLFCVPSDKFEHVYGGAIEDLNAEIASPASGEPYEADTPIEMVILQMLVSKYSC